MTNLVMNEECLAPPGASRFAFHRGVPLTGSAAADVALVTSGPLLP